MSNLPTGVVTFLFTDIEGSTQLFERHPDAMQRAHARHHALLRNAIEAHGGHIFQVVGDGICAAFGETEPALSAALAAQRALHGEDWGELGALRVRLGLHTGEAEADGDEYLSSLTLVRAQRVTAAGHGGQTLLSSAMADAVRSRLPDGTTLRELGSFKLRGLAEAEGISELVAADLPGEFPPLRVEDAGTSPATALDELIRGKLVGRSAELQQLKRHWDQAQQARGHLVLLSGEPGVGKTRLARELIAQAQASGATVLRGGCYEFEATTPYLPFVEAIRDWAHRQTPSQLRAALGDLAPEIAKFAPEIETKLGSITPNAPLSPNEERMRLFDNVARFLQSLAAARGLLVFTDDLHWADQGTLSLLRYLLRSLQGDRVLFLAPYREIELDRAHPLASALVEWNRERLATRVALGRLSRADTDALLATLFDQGTVSEDFAEALYRETEGNPFFVEEVVKALIEQGQIYREDGGWGRKNVQELAIPQSVKEAIGRRLDRLSDGAADALRTAAALGKSFGFRELAAVSATEEDILLDALDEGIAAQLIRPADSGDSFAFTHDKIREVLYEEMNPIRRRRLHLRIGESLESMLASPGARGRGNEGIRVQDLAHHFTQAGEFERSLTYLRQAADDATRVFAHDEALKFLVEARESAEGLHRDQDIAAVDEQIGNLHNARGASLLAAEHYEKALANKHWAGVRAELKTRIGSCYASVGDPRGLAMLDQAIAELDPATQTDALARATAMIGRYHHYRTEHRKSLEFLEQARALAEPLDNPATLTHIYGFLAGAHQQLVQYDEADRIAHLCVSMGERKDFPEAIAMGSEFLAENCVGRGTWNDAIRYARRCREEGNRIGSMDRVAWSGFGLANGFHGKGLLAEARTEIEATLALSEQLGESRLSTWADCILAMIASDQGAEATAAFHAERAWEHAKKLNQLVLCGMALNALACSAMRRGDAEAALAWQSQYLELVQDTENRVVLNLALARAAEVSLAAGRLDEGERIAREAVAIAELAGAPHYVALASSVLGRIAFLRGAWDEAAAILDKTSAAYASIGSELELARARVYRAAIHEAKAEHAAARTGLTEARRVFAALGAVSDCARVDERLAKSA